MQCKFFLTLVAFAAAGSAQTGSFTIHSILHAVGEERYTISPAPDGGFTMETNFELSDRGNKRTTTASLRMKSGFAPLSLEVKTTQRTLTARVTEADVKSFPIFGGTPFAIQMMLLRYWGAHGQPSRIPMLTPSGTSPTPIEIELAGRDSIQVEGKVIALKRLTLNNLMFGREVIWLDAQGDLAAAMTFAGGLPMEAVRTQFEPALPQLYKSGVAQEMSNLAALGRQVSPEQKGDFAIVGATLVDATGSPALQNSVLIVRNGRIAAVGPRAKVEIPAGMKTVDATGQTVLPGLWEMHIHFSGVEFGPALLAAGVTTARDCGGEFDYLVAQEKAITQGALSPRLLLAGLVDSGGLKAFGHVTADTAEEGRAAVQKYHAAGFQQIKLYTFLAPEVIQAICDEAHRLGMTVTGHVPQALNTFEGITAGMDQINHLNYVSSMLRAPGSPRGTPIDFDSESTRKAIAFLKDHHTVVDPTAGWGEMAGHSKDVDVATFEPGIRKAPFVLISKFQGMGGDTTPEQMQSRISQNLAVIAALHKAGIPIVPGSDTGLPGYGLIRELELYVQAGMSPLEAIQSGTIVSAKAMGLDRELGTIEVGKRADFILVNGNPAVDIKALRHVAQVSVNGRLYQAAKLWRAAGFKPQDPDLAPSTGKMR